MMTRRFALAGLCLLVSTPGLRAQATVGWYNGDRQMGIPGMSNWYVSATQLARTYDNFVVPDGGWTVAGVFSNNSFYDAPPVTQASWEIRMGMGPGAAGTLAAAGIGAATVTFDSRLNVYRIQVDGLDVALPAGRYWVNVAPVGPGHMQSYVAATLGTNAAGTPPGNDGGALHATTAGLNFIAISTTGQKGTSADFSQGVLIKGTAAAPPSITDQWRADVAILADQMLAMHSLPLPGIPVEDFRARAADLYNRIPELAEPGIRTEFVKLVASIGDAHTDVQWPYPSPFRQLPLSFYWFDDGIYVTAAAESYRNLLGGRLLTVGTTPVEDATPRLAALVPHENEQWLKHRIPLQELTNADYLFGTGLIANVETVPLIVQVPADGTIVPAEVQTYGKSLGPRMNAVFQGDPPLYMRHPDRNYWATLLDNGATIYFQYNRCREDSQQASADFFRQLHDLMAQDGVQRIVLDLRNNSGGYTSILSPWIAEIQASRFNAPGRLYVIVGRATFSAAMEATNHLHDRTAAIFVGEATGAKPRFQLRRGDFGLPYFGIRVSYSRGVESANDPSPSLTPDIPAGLTFAQYMAGVDPALDAILSIPVPGT